MAGWPHPSDVELPMKRLLLAFALFAAFLPAAQAAENPLAPGEHTFQSNGLKLWYKVSGHGPVAILPTPGWGPSAEYLFLSLQPLEQQFTIVYLDTRATGRSEAPKADAITMDDFTSDLDNLRRHLRQPRPWFIGHSMGGTQILEYALRFPDHVQGLLVLAGAVSWNNPDKARQRLYKQRVQEQIERRRGRPGFDAALKAWNGDPLPTTDEEFKAQTLATAPITMWDPAKIGNAKPAFEQVRFSLAAVTRFDRGVRTDLEPRLRRIAAPTLIVAGSDDVEVPWQETLALHRGLPHSKLILIPNAAHFAWIEQPEIFYAQIRAFLPEVGYRP